ncbi:MAG: NADH-quinone oxidoreductase subunit H [Candidatus Gastranaerophilaceae bacterium]
MNYLYFWYIQFLSKYNIPEMFGDITFPILPFCIIACAIIFIVLFLVLLERKILALFTQRKGPNRVGFWGILQTVADAIKLLCKQNLDTRGVDKFLFNLAPILVFVPAMVLWGLIPYSSEFEFMGFSVSAMFYLAVAIMPVIGIVLAGFASNNKYSLIGAVRSVAQIISYEIPMAFVLLSVITLASSMNLKDIVMAQVSNVSIFGWFVIPCFLGFCIMFICAIAELNRCPFDLPEAESELVAGYNVEYSGMRFALFFLAEYAMLFVMCTFIVTLFFGGYLPLTAKYISEYLFSENQYLQSLIYFEQAIWLFIKTLCLVIVVMLVRATLPRLNSSALMAFSWKVLLPVSIINFLIMTIFKYVVNGGIA